jgi:hypothetical protein
MGGALGKGAYWSDGQFLFGVSLGDVGAGTWEVFFLPELVPASSTIHGVETFGATNETFPAAGEVVCLGRRRFISCTKD